MKLLVLTAIRGNRPEFKLATRTPSFGESQEPFGSWR